MPQQLVPFVLSCVLFFQLAVAQSKLRFTTDKQQAKISFEWRMNQIIIPVMINGVSMNFLVDTGVGHMLIFDSHKAKQLGFSTDRPFMLRGLGSHPALRAYHVKLNSVLLEGIEFTALDALVLPESEFILSRRLGTQIDGILGYDLFADYPVLIDYQRKFVLVNAPRDAKRWKRKKAIHFPLSIYARKPHISLEITTNNQLLQGDLILDSGLSDALWLFSSHKAIEKTPPTFDDFLGTGINGEVFGSRGKLPFLDLMNFRLNQVKVAYPSIDFQNQSLQFSENRIGSIGAELLSRFKLLFDYPNKKVSFYPTRNTSKPFYYNLSGLEFEYDGVQLIKRKLNAIQQSDAKGGERRD